MAKNIHVSNDFLELTIRSIDDRQRICIGDILKGFSRVQVFQSERGEILLIPMVEIPSSEAWLYKNKQAIDSVRKGLKDASEGKLSKLDPDSL